MSRDYVVDVVGDTGSPVLLLAGGASSSHGFFPGLTSALAAHRVVSLDRAGTGRAQDLGRASLANGSAAAAQVLAELGPAVVVGQSLGGAQAVQIAVDYPELVAGLVLIDPTPLDTPSQVRMAAWLLTAMSLPGRLPVVGKHLDPRVFRLLAGKVDPRAEAGVEVMVTSASLATTVRALAVTVEETAALAARVTRLEAPAVLLTADRTASHPVRLSHERLAAALGARLVAPPGAIHPEHLRDPDGVNDLVLQVVRESLARR